ncbi:hypothetical protein SAMN05878426_102557 [Phaeovulum vinaykumarii]|uniref:Uncharacterized protein n=2 Tax=Phaeovulum vinaykumarii TaxID=407234 RepID=A0A1N7KVH8_9RHOB|nr:hypothetical protein SAMN05421795_102216 [Phaeovulum vinaykumarii]SOC01229.1 hypothetical protein SAMN05878426_102557 [Phaeovulum vinaykumarii]
MMAEAGSQPAMPRVECRVTPGKGADMGAETFCAALSAEIAARLAPGAAALIRAEIAQPNPRTLRVRLSWFATPEGGGTALGESPEMGLDVMDRDRLPDAQIRRLARDLVTRSGLSLRD